MAIPFSSAPSSPSFSPLSVLPFSARSSYPAPRLLVVPHRGEGVRFPAFGCSLSSIRQHPYKALTCYARKESTQKFERLFSNLNQVTLKREPGSVTSAVFLVAGTTVGAGILAIPAVTQEAGFLASAITCIFCWIYMVLTGLLIAEVNVNTMCELGSGGVSLFLINKVRVLLSRVLEPIRAPDRVLSRLRHLRNYYILIGELTFGLGIFQVSMAMRTLGKVGVQVACGSYIFIHYALLVAYVARTSDILTNILGIPLWEGATLFSLVFGSICYFGSQRFIGAANGLLIFGIIASFTVLVGAAGGDLKLDSLLQTNFAAVPHSIPIISLSFVYQNVVPVLCTNLEGNLSKVRTSIIFGTAIPLVLFLIWDAVILGSIPKIGANGDKIADPLEYLRSNSGMVGPIIEVFSLLAIATSYIGFILGLADFLSDLLKLPSGQSKPLPYLLTLVPPLILSLLDPEIFFKALDFAGTYGVLVLFGVVPAAMSWSERYSDPAKSPALPPIVPGGRYTLFFVMAGAGCVILSQILDNFTH